MPGYREKLVRVPDRARQRDPSIPEVLWCRGLPLSKLERPMAAIIGGRRVTEHTLGLTSLFARDLHRHGFDTINGLARGVDTAALRANTSLGRSCVAVLPCGINQIYPLANIELATWIERHGLIVSEYEPGVPPAPHRFLDRNRIITALATFVIAVQVRERSGTWAALTKAVAQGVPIFVLNPEEMEEPTRSERQGAEAAMFVLGATLVNTAGGVIQHL